MHVAAPHGPARQRHRESTGVQLMTCRDHLADTDVAAAAEQFAALSCRLLDWLATRHRAQHPSEPSMGDARAEGGTKPHGPISSRPCGSRSFSSSSAPRRDRASVAFGLRAEVLPAGPARYQVTPKYTTPFR